MTRPTASSPTFDGHRGGDALLVAVNLTPVPRHAYRIGVPGPGRWVEILNTDAETLRRKWARQPRRASTPVHWQCPTRAVPQSIDLTLPPLGVVILRHEPTPGKSG